MRPLNTYWILLAVLFHAPAFCKTNVDDITVTEAWVRATYPGQQTGAAYFTIKSEKAAKLTGVQTPVAKRAEIHTMHMKEGVMQMRELDSFVLPAGQNVTFARGGHHIMLIDLKQALKPGDKVPLKLNIEHSDGNVVVDAVAEVRKK
jgi:periplasmic copper chaperone A